MKCSMKMAFVLLVFVLIMTLATGLAEGNSDREIVLPEVGIAFTLPEGFGENIADPDSGLTAVFHSVNPMTGFELFVGPGDDLKASKPTLIEKVKDNRNIWEEIVYGEHEFFIYRSELFIGDWNATIVFGDYYNPFISLRFPETTEGSFPLAEEILSSVRFLTPNVSE